MASQYHQPLANFSHSTPSQSLNSTSHWLNHPSKDMPIVRKSPVTGRIHPLEAQSQFQIRQRLANSGLQKPRQRPYSSSDWLNPPTQRRHRNPIPPVTGYFLPLMVFLTDKTASQWQNTPANTGRNGQIPPVAGYKHPLKPILGPQNRQPLELFTRERHTKRIKTASHWLNSPTQCRPRSPIPPASGYKHPLSGIPEARYRQPVDINTRLAAFQKPDTASQWI